MVFHVAIDGAKLVQCLFERDMAVQVVAPVFAHSPLSFALNRPFEAKRDAASLLLAGSERRGEVEMTGNL